MAVLIGTLDTTGSSNSFFFDASQAATKRSCTASGTLESLSMVARNSSGSMNLKLAVWADSAGAPGALLAVTGIVPGTTATDTFTVTASLVSTIALTSGTDYWLGFLSYGATFNTVIGTTAGLRGRDLTAGTSTHSNPFGSPNYTDNPPAAGLLIQGDGTLSGGGGQTVTAVAAVGLGDFPAPVFQAGATVTAPVADALGDFPASEMRIGVDLSAPAALTFGDFPAPTITGSGNSTVTGVPAIGLGDFPVPTVRWGNTAAAVPATALGDFPAPTVTATASATVTAVPADGLADFPAPTVDDGAAPVPPALGIGVETALAAWRSTGDTGFPAFAQPETAIVASAYAETELVLA